MTYGALYKKGCAVLENAGIEEAKLDSRLLLEFVCGTNRNDLLVHGDREMDDVLEERFFKLLAERAGHIPLQHLTGVQEFMGLEFEVDEHVLIPRQDTEILVEEVLRELHDGMSILDMCTGSGCILISLLHYSNHCSGMGVDISPEALQVAERNARRLLSENEMESPEAEHDMSERVCFIKGDLFDAVTGKFEFIVSNPPYIRSAVCEKLMPEVRDHEPRGALDGHEDGLFFYRKIVERAPEYLTNGGRLYFEIGYDQAEAVQGLMIRRGYKEVCVVKDYAGLDRVVYGTYIASATSCNDPH